jgi:hypothetical protein
MIGHRFRHAGCHHVGVADGLDLLDTVHGRQAVEAAHHLVEEADGAFRSQRLGQRHEALEIGEQHRGFLEAVGDDGVGLVGQTVDDGVGEDVAQQRLGLRPRVLGQAEGVVDHRRDHGDGGEGGGDVERVQHGVVHRIRAALRGNSIQAATCSASPIAVKTRTRRRPLQPEDHEECGGAGKILDMDSRRCGRDRA